MATKSSSKVSVQHAEDSPGFLLWQVAHLWHRRITSNLKTLDLTNVQFLLLAGLKTLKDEKREFVTQTNLAEYAKTDNMMTSKEIRKLESKGLVNRGEHPTDTRAKALALTPQGEKLLVKAAQVVDAVDAAFFTSDTTNPAAVAELMRLFHSRFAPEETGSRYR